MITRSVILILILILFSNCTSTTEEEGIDEVAEFYNCQVSFTKGISASTSDDDGSYFEITLSGDHLKKYNLEDVAKNAARIFFLSLNDDEKEQYNYISVIVEAENKSIGLKSTKEDLALIISKQKLYFDISEFIKNNNYEKFFNLLNPDVLSEIDKDTMSFKLNQIEPNFGKITETIILGYDFIETEYNNKSLSLIRFKGIQKCEKQNLNFLIVTSREKEDNLIYGFKF